MPLWLLSTLALAAAPEMNLQRYEFQQMHMGVSFGIVLYAPDEATAKTASAAAYQRIAALDQSLSDYKPDSELNRLCQTAGTGRAVKVSPDLLVMLSRSVELSQKSAGAFDITVSPLVRLWRKSRKSKTLPTPDELAAARALVDYRQIQIDAAAGTVTLLQPGMRLDLGGIAAGYAVDEALAVLRQHGVSRALIDSSGDIGVSDAPPGKPGWRVGVAPLEPEGDPSQYLILKNAAVTTSGDAYQFIEIGGTRYSHIVDPQTGLGLTTRSSVTVISQDCTTADSYATAVTVLGPEKGLKLIEATPSAAALFIQVREGTPRTSQSTRWPQ